VNADVPVVDKLFVLFPNEENPSKRCDFLRSPSMFVCAMTWRFYPVVSSNLGTELFVSYICRSMMASIIDHDTLSNELADSPNVHMGTAHNCTTSFELLFQSPVMQAIETPKWITLTW
jgi:hypothetical protein